jgi:hypothetical protein
MGVSVGMLPLGNRYSSRLHFGMSKVGKGEEKGMVACVTSTHPGQKGWLQKSPKIPSAVIASSSIVKALLYRTDNNGA